MEYKWAKGFKAIHAGCTERVFKIKVEVLVAPLLEKKFKLMLFKSQNRIHAP
jgi:hypothetical protein